MEITTGGKENWARLLPAFGGSQNEWTRVNFALDSYVGCSDFKFRFHLISDSVDTSDGWYIDDVQVSLTPTSVPQEPTSIPACFALYQNHPNPFNPITAIQYAVGSKQIKAADGGPVLSEVGGRWTADSPCTHVTLEIYNILGQLVRVLVDEERASGSYTVYWDGSDKNGRPVSSGIYFYKLDAGDFTEVKKMVLLK